MTCSDVAKHLGVSWDAIRDIEKEYLHKHYARPSLKHVMPIAIDEIAIQKGHKYLTVMMDLKTGRAIFVDDGKDAAALKPFLEKAASRSIEDCCGDVGHVRITAFYKHFTQSRRPTSIRFQRPRIFQT
jgi:transposase